MKKIVMLMLLLIISVGLVGCGESADTNEEKNLDEVTVQVQPKENAENKANDFQEKPKINREFGERDGARKIPPERLDEVKKILDEKVEAGEMTAEERDKLIEDINNGNLKNLREILDKNNNETPPA